MSWKVAEYVDANQVSETVHGLSGETACVPMLVDR